ncbi:MAG TPA: hypothetical protein VF334_16440 [Polyangia bacterium]
MRGRAGLALVLGALAVGCATTGATPAAATAPTPAATQTPRTTTQTPATTQTPRATTRTPATTQTPPATTQAPAATAKDAKALLRAALAEVGKRHFDQARTLLDQARPLVGADRDLDFRAVNVAIALYTNQGDYESAARFVLDSIRRRGGDRADEQLFSLHNWMAILREAEGDLPGAILECAARTAHGYEGTWEPAAERLQLTRFKDDWHRAYLFRMYAEQLTGTRRDAALYAAEQARKDYVAAGGYADSTAVLDALFAMYDQRWNDVRAAVHRVDIAKDDDEEDLYLLFSALDAAGDHEGAAAIRRRIEKDPPYWNIWRAWIASDTDSTPPAMKRFSPRYPKGKRL